MTDLVVFLDALSPDEATGILDEHLQGTMDAGVPRVTPRIMAGVYTGTNPAENGMLRDAKYGETAKRPEKATIIEQAMRSDYSVLSMGMPFMTPFREVNDDSALNGPDIGEGWETEPDDSQPWIFAPPSVGNMKEDHPDKVYSSKLDRVRRFFMQAKEAIRLGSYDVAFIGLREIDSYCHFHHTETRNGKPYRQHLIDNIESMLVELYNQVNGEMMFFSDHGQTELTDTFRVNQWLKQKGYLDYTIDHDYLDAKAEYEGRDLTNIEVPNQVTIHTPGVEVNEQESDVLCADRFDSCMTLLSDPDDVDTEALREDLLSTGMYRSVKYKWEMFDEDAEFYEQMPDIIPDRDEGVFVSGNLYQEPIGMGYHRTGVHDRTACFGATTELSIPDDEVVPEDMYEIIADFIGLEGPPSPIDISDLREWTPEERQLAHDTLGEALNQ